MRDKIKTILGNPVPQVRAPAQSRTMVDLVFSQTQSETPPLHPFLVSYRTASFNIVTSLFCMCLSAAVNYSYLL